MPELLVVDDLRLEAGPRAAPLVLVGGVSFAVGRGEALGIVGESGAGKSLTAAALPNLLPAGIRVTAGHVRLDGHDVLTADARTLRSLRGRRIGYVGQDPMSALDPTMTVVAQVAEAVRAHPDAAGRIPHRAAARARALETLDEVGLPELRSRAGVYPHELSGGQRQRAVLAMALAAGPDLLVADEPTSALDVTLEAQFLALLVALRRTRQLALVLISHDLALVAAVCDRLLVFHGGQVVEQGSRDQVLGAPRHPYTQKLVAAAREAAPGAV
ncbi:MAG: ABC transporter ATP-binding protein [Thermoanaerobaculia bacterium]|nr:ABC transporter ATP-binding protein [Thermoanaerobaculia bacterium]